MNTRIFNELDSQISITFHKSKHVCEAVTEDVAKFAELNFNELTIFITKKLECQTQFLQLMILLLN